MSSLSLSLLATGIDSVFDIGSNVMLYWINKKAARLDVNKWPVGGSRLPPIGNIVYGEQAINKRRLTFHLVLMKEMNTGTLMGSVNLVVVVESIRTIVSHGDNELNTFHVASIAAVAAALGKS